MALKCVDPGLQLDVDVIILDYLLHSAIQALLDEVDERRAGRHGRYAADNHLHTVDSTFYGPQLTIPQT